MREKYHILLNDWSVTALMCSLLTCGKYLDVLVVNRNLRILVTMGCEATRKIKNLEFQSERNHLQGFS